MNLGKVLHGWRRTEALNVRQAAKVIGVSHATISRIENGRSITGETMAKVLVWLVHGSDKGLANDRMP